MALEYTGDMCDVFPYQEDYRAIKIYQWQLVQPWSGEKTGQTYCSSDMKCYTSGTSSAIPSSTRTISKTILDILEYMYKMTFQEKMRLLVSRLGTHLSHSKWKVLLSPSIRVTQVTMKSKIYPMWRSHQWKSGTRSQSCYNYQQLSRIGTTRIAHMKQTMFSDQWIQF